MELSRITEKAKGRFLIWYDLVYTLRGGREKRYEMVSRKPVAAPADLSDAAPDGVVMIVFSRDKSRILLNREFRPAVNKVVYNFPAGLLLPGEAPEAAAARELWEETGLALDEAAAVYGRSYGSIGLSCESSLVIQGTADDAVPFGGEDNPAEEIAPVWVSRADARAILNGGDITARVQMVLAAWAENAFTPQMPAPAPEAQSSGC